MKRGSLNPGKSSYSGYLVTEEYQGNARDSPGARHAGRSGVSAREWIGGHCFVYVSSNPRGSRHAVVFARLVALPQFSPASHILQVCHGRAPRRVLCLSLFLVLCTTAGAAKYGEQCSKNTDCEQQSAPHCKIFFTDKSYAFNEMCVTYAFL